MLLQTGVPGLLHGHHTIAEGLFAPPQDLFRDQVKTFEGFPQKVLLHPMLLRQKDKEHSFISCLGHQVSTVSEETPMTMTTDLGNPHLLRQGEVVRRESVVQERHSELQAEKQKQN